MSGTIGGFWRYMFSPRLFKNYGPNEKQYIPSSMEHYADQMITALSVIWKVGIYTSPIIIGILYKRGVFSNTDSMYGMSKLATGIGVILIVAFIIRGAGRATNPMYVQFLEILDQAQYNASKPAIKHLSRYDFEFFAWPVEFQAKDVVEIEGDRYDQQHRIYIQSPSAPSFLTSLPFGVFLRPPLHLLGYLATHTFGIRLLYPGQLHLVQAMTRASCTQGRTWLVQMQKGQRAKVRARDGNDIDTMFVDKRNVSTNGSTLVICCEGNAGFYEMGIMATPIEAGYSVLGWNHPGFGGSTGVPYPAQEQNAIEIVMQYAMYKLQFPVENILLFGWSIGGYTSTWAAMNFPKVKGIVLDASFDDLMPLALNHMPGWADSIVRLAVREYVNLNHYEQLSMYPGPVLIIRRTLDEVIALNENDISSNRCNYLLTKLMKYRYPQIFDEAVMKIVNDYLALNPTAAQEFVRAYTINDDLCRQQLESYVSELGKTFPMDIGDNWTTERKIPLALYLVRKYFKDHVSLHCAPLPVDMFQIPWDVNVESDYVMP